MMKSITGIDLGQIDIRETMQKESRGTKTLHPNVLTISGTGRNVGKTILACSIIRSLQGRDKITAVKISPHFHEVGYKGSLVEKTGHYAIYKEDNKKGLKDSSRMLKAGADEVYYVQSKDPDLRTAWSELTNLMSPLDPVIIESGGILDVIDPGISVLVTQSNLKIENYRNANWLMQVIPVRKISDIGPGLFTFRIGQWEIQEKML